MRRRTVQQTRNMCNSNLYVRSETPQQRQSRSRRCSHRSNEDHSDASLESLAISSTGRSTSSLAANRNLVSCFQRVTSTPVTSGRRSSSWSQTSRISNISSISSHDHNETAQAATSRSPVQRIFTANAWQQGSRIVGSWASRMSLQAQPQEEEDEEDQLHGH